MTLTKQKPRKTTAAHRKLNGNHHTRNHHYIKHYWPYLPIFAVLGLGMFTNSFLARAHHNVLGYATNVSARVLLAETNDERTKRNEPALQFNDKLTAAAQAKANDMAARGYWSHVTPDGKQPWSFIDAAGYQYEAAGENLAYGFGTSEQVMTAWMNSPTHRANILNSVYQDVGFATANVKDYQGTGPETIIVAEYGEPAGMINASTGDTTSTPVVLGTTTQNVSRVSLISTATWLPMTLALICGAALMWFFMRHALAWHKVLVKGEHFVVSHPFLDVALMTCVVVVFVLAHAAGTIL